MTASLEIPDAGPVDEQVRLPDGCLTAGKDVPIGGQAVLEGVMMRGVSTWAVAVRKSPNGYLVPMGEPSGDQEPSVSGDGAGPASTDGGRAVSQTRADAGGEIEIYSESFVSWIKQRRAFRVPVVRGVVALVESLKIGFRALGMSANAQIDDEEEQLSGRAWGLTIAVSLLFAVGLFFILPVTITNFWKESLGSSVVFVIVEKLIRVSIFIVYLWAISKLPDLRRVFEYHGAEHKTIACYEAGDRLVPERAQLYSRLHVRCGTSFLLIVMIIAVFVFAPFGRPALHWLILSRVLGLFLVAGLAYEIIKWAGRNRAKRWVRSLMWPGLQLQRLTTREPSREQLAVGIAALEAVLAVEDPAASSEEDRLGMEVVA